MAKREANNEKPAAEKKAKTPVVKVYTAKSPAPKDAKLPKQAAIIVEQLTKAGKPQTREALVKLVTPHIQTKQPVERIIAYYQSRLVNEGWITITRQDPPAEKKAA